MLYLASLGGLFITSERGDNSSKDIKKMPAKTRFAVIIPARNEAHVIGRLLESLKRQSYPTNLVEIAVIPNNCTDATKTICAQYDIKILSIDIDTSTKGDVLHWAFSYYVNRADIDAFVVFDADNIVDPHFLAAVNDALLSGFRVCQGMRLTTNGGFNYVSKGYDAYYAIQNHFFNKPRMQMGLSSSINGSGFVIAKQLIDEGWFDVHTFIEDMEFAGICALHQERIAFVESAVAYDEQPTRLSDAWIQRRRWSTGLNQCRRKYGPNLLATYLRNGWVPALDILLLYSSPVINVISCTVCIVSLIMQAILLPDLCIPFVLGCTLAITALIASITLCKVAVSPKGRHTPLATGAIHFPIFLLSWMAIDLVSMFHDVKEWKVTKHSGNTQNFS